MEFSKYLIILFCLSGPIAGCALLPLGPDNPYRYKPDHLNWSRSAPETPEAVNRIGDVTLGMTQADVLSLWGQPRDAQVAGRPENGNVRWIYTQSPSRWETGDSRVLYFENGRVVGWESR